MEVKINWLILLYCMIHTFVTFVQFCLKAIEVKMLITVIWKIYLFRTNTLQMLEMSNLLNILHGLCKGNKLNEETRKL